MASEQPFVRSTSGVVPFWPWMMTILPSPPALPRMYSQTAFAEATESVAMKVSPGAPSALRSTLTTGTPAAWASLVGTVAAAAPAGM